MNIAILFLFVVIISYISAYCTIGGGKSSIYFFDKNYTTVAKGVAILLIMAGHCSGQWDGGRLLTPCGGIGVAIFLIASGYGLNESYKRNGLKDFWKKRLGRVYIPYFIVAVIFALFYKWSIDDCLWNFSCFHCPYWFVTYIVECYIVFWLTSRIIPQYRNFIIMILSIATLFLLPELQAEQSFSFITGIVLSTHKDKLMASRENKRTYLLTCLVLIFVGVSFLAIKQLPIVRSEAIEFEMNIIQLMIKYPLGLFVLLAIAYSKKLLTNPFLYFVGLISYELYLVHFPFYTLIGDRLWPALLLITVSLVVAYPFYRFNNRIHKKIIAK